MKRGEVTRKLAQIATPYAVILLVSSWLCLAPGAESWPQRHPLLGLMPALLLLAAAALGFLFQHARVAGMAVLVAAALFRARLLARNPEPTGQEWPFAVLVCVLLPVCAVTLHRMRERSILSLRGGLMVYFAVLGAAMIYLLPGLPAFGAILTRAVPGPVVSPAYGLPGIPAGGMVLLLLCAPVLLWPRKWEHPVPGALLLLAVASVFAALGRGLPTAAHAGSGGVMLAYFTASALALLWSVLETAWRHANLDELTELPTRRALRHHLGSLGASYSIAMVDIDHFKRINDRYGHNVGDQVLRFMAAALRGNQAGRAYRCGGEEFAVVCTRGGPAEHEAALEALRAAIAGKRFVIRASARPGRKPTLPHQAAGGNQFIRITVSVGLASAGERYAGPQEVLKAADQALYRAKEAGRNRLCRDAV